MPSTDHIERRDILRQIYLSIAPFSFNPFTEETELLLSRILRLSDQENSFILASIEELITREVFYRVKT